MHIYLTFKKHSILMLPEWLHERYTKGKYPDMLCKVDTTIAPRANRIHRRKNVSTISFININVKNN